MGSKGEHKNYVLCETTQYWVTKSIKIKWESFSHKKVLSGKKTNQESTKNRSKSNTEAKLRFSKKSENAAKIGFIK